MSRPLYETNINRENEREVASYLSDKFNLEAIKLPANWPIDYCFMINKKITAFVEIKCRDNYSYEKLNQLGGYMIDLRKLVSIRRLSKEAGVAGVICVRLSDGHYYFQDTSERGFPLVMGGRTDRGDPSDIEPCVLIPMERFQRC